MTKNKFFKFLIVFLCLVSLVAALTVSASAGVSGSAGDFSLTARYLPFDVTFFNLFNENSLYYEFACAQFVYADGYGIQRRDTNFGSEDYRNNLAQFVIYKEWTSWRWRIDNPIVYDSSLNIDNLWPCLSTGNIRLYDYDDRLPDERGGYMDCRWEGRIVFGDGSSSDDLEDYYFANYFTVPLNEGEGYYNVSIDAVKYNIAETLSYFDEHFSDRGGVWYIDWIVFDAVPVIYSDSSSDDPNPGIFVSSSDSSSYVGYCYIRPLSSLNADKLSAFGAQRVIYQDASDLFDWIGTALSGVLMQPIAYLGDFPVSIGSLFFTVVAVFGIFFVFRAFAGG